MYECSAAGCNAPTDDDYCAEHFALLHATCTGCFEVAPLDEMRDGECGSCREYFVDMYGAEVA
jgi:hypothetical protein